MPSMMTRSKELSDRSFTSASILLASDSERHGSTLYRALQQEGLTIEYAGDYPQVNAALRHKPFDMVLLEVTGDHAVEAAVAAALQVKRSHPRQFLGYLADAHLETKGLAGDAVLSRSLPRLRQQLQQLLREE